MMRWIMMLLVSLFVLPSFAQDATEEATQEANVIWQPAPGITWQWQLTEEVNTSYDVDMYDIDLFDTPQDVIDVLHAKGRIVSTLEGGYDLDALAKSVEAHIRVLADL